MKRLSGRRFMVLTHRWSPTSGDGQAPWLSFAIRPKGEYVRIQIVVFGRSLNIHWW